MERLRGDGSFRYVVFGRECGSNGTKHLQGYVECGKPRRLASLKKDYQQPHWEPAKGSKEQNFVYCTKEGDWEERGASKTQGQRSDLDSIKEEIINGSSELEIANAHFSRWVVYRRSFEAYRALIAPTRDRNEGVEVFYLWGHTGTGKTKSVWEQEENLFVFPGRGWFDGYRGQEAALFDDFRGGEDGIEFGYLLRLLDRYPMDVPIKGGFVDWRPKRIYITSNLELDALYVGHDKAPFRRRLKEERFFRKDPRSGEISIEVKSFN